MARAIKRLRPGDEEILELLAKEDADFDLEGRGAPLVPLAPPAARKYLANPSVFFWVLVEEAVVIGFLSCILVPLRAGDGQELLLYEIGVRSSSRRRGMGRALLDHMEAWMRKNGINEVWVCADNQIAVDFYRGCGFSAREEQPIYLTRVVQGSNGAN